MRNRKVIILLVLGFLVGISLLLYPAFSDFWNSKTQSRVIDHYESVLEQIKPEDYSHVFEGAYDYNRRLYATKNPLLQPEQVTGYWDNLSVTDYGMMGYLKIDRIGVELPI